MREKLVQIFRTIKRFTNNPSPNTLKLFLIISFISAICGGVIWGFIGVKINMEFGAIAILIGVMNGIVGFLFKRDEKENFYLWMSAVFSFLGYLLGKFILYTHWSLIASGIIEEKEFVLFEIINYVSFELLIIFGNQLIFNFDLFDILWIALVLITALQLADTDYRKIDPDYTIMTEY